MEAVKKLLPLRIGALYMEMGTGKTRVALELISERAKKKKLKKVLWLCPCSVKKNLVIDLDKHCNRWEDLIKIAGIESMSQSDRVFLETLKYVDENTMVIVDESNLVKNFFAKRTKRITELGKLSKYRLILNGTPISKNEADLYAQWFFLDQRVFGYRTFWSFAANHLEYDENKRVRRVLNTDYLTDKIAPYSVSIKKNDVLKLKGKRVFKEVYPLTYEQVEHYNEVMDMLLSEVDEFEPHTIYRLFTGLQLVTSGRRVYQEENHIKSVPFFDDPKSNPRIRKISEIIDSLDGKVIIWVKYRHESQEIQSVLPEGSYAIGTGEKTVKAREKELDRFRNDENCRFLIANKVCGGYGLNLQFCHQAIYYNNDFNFATRAQSEDRIHRIGQEYEVDIYDICAFSKIDVRILSCLERKESLCDAMKEQIKIKANLKDWLNGKENDDLSRKKEQPKERGCKERVRKT